jgi:transcriptional regulator with XRE-family HTH domain
MTSARQAVAQEVQRAVRSIGPSVAEAAKALHVERQTVYRWQRGNIPYERLDQLAALVGTLTIRIGEDNKAAWPEWARQLDDKLNLLLASAGIDPITDALHEVLETDEPPEPDATPPATEPHHSDEPR